MFLFEFLWLIKNKTHYFKTNIFIVSFMIQNYYKDIRLIYIVFTVIQVFTLFLIEKWINKNVVPKIFPF